MSTAGRQRPFILLVEDNADDVVLIQRVFRTNNVANEVVVTQDGAEALDFLFGPERGPFRPPDSSLPQLVILDLKLPKVDGFEVLRRIRSDHRTSRLPVVILTTSNEQDDIVRSYEGGANSYVRKPVDFTRFTEAVRNLGVYWMLINQPMPR